MWMLTSYSQLTNSIVYALWIFKWPEQSQSSSSAFTNSRRKKLYTHSAHTPNGKYNEQKTRTLAAIVRGENGTKRLASEDPMKPILWCWLCARTLNNNYCYYSWINNGHCEKFKRKWALDEGERDMRTGHSLQMFNKTCMSFVDGADGWSRRREVREGWPMIFQRFDTLSKHRQNTVIFKFGSSQTDEWTWMM